MFYKSQVHSSVFTLLHFSNIQSHVLLTSSQCTYLTCVLLHIPTFLFIITIVSFILHKDDICCTFDQSLYLYVTYLHLSSLICGLIGIFSAEIVKFWIFVALFCSHTRTECGKLTYPDPFRVHDITIIHLLFEMFSAKIFSNVPDSSGPSMICVPFLRLLLQHRP